MNADSAFEDTVLARIDEIVERAVEQGQAPGVVAAVARGDSLHVATAGVMAVGGPPMGRDTLFRISSNTKPITAVAALSLIDAGVLDLDGTIDELLPELANRRVLLRPEGPLEETVPAQRSITVREQPVPEGPSSLWRLLGCAGCLQHLLLDMQLDLAPGCRPHRLGNLPGASPEAAVAAGTGSTCFGGEPEQLCRSSLVVPGHPEVRGGHLVRAGHAPLSLIRSQIDDKLVLADH